MKSKLLSHRTFLKKLQKLSKRDKKKTLELADKSEVNCLCECVTNLLAGNIPLSAKQKKCLKKHKHLIRKVGDKKRSIVNKKRLLVQSGGSFLLALLPAAISAITSLIGR